jgi:catechol 2,3-dioxygenase-like lactoylglutathione lyase family enzyme
MKLVDIAYFTDDVGSMADFYRRLLSAEPISRSADMAVFLVGETKVFIHKTYVAGGNDLPPENHAAYAVTDVDETCRDLLAAGLTVEDGPNDYYWGRSAYLRDPDGHLIEVTQGKT